MLRKKVLVGLALAVFLASMASTVFAGGTSFNIIVPKFGQYSTTPDTLKSSSYNIQYATFNQLTVGANKTMYFDCQIAGVTCPQLPGTTGYTINLPYSINLPSLIHVKGRISITWSEPVNVQVTGYFNSH